VNFSGYIPLRRGLISHIQEGRLSNNEALTFIVLLMLADSSTGAGTINAPTLRAFLPELSYDAAKRALLALEEKGYIYRAITPFSTRAYRFWVGNYRPTTGPHRSLQTDISKALETRDVSDIKYIKPALEGAPEGAPETALEGAPNYKKEKDTKKETTPIEPTVCASVSAPQSASVSHARQRTKRSTFGSACALHDATHDALHDATQSMTHSMHHDTTHSMHQPLHHETIQTVQPVATRSPEEAGIKWSGYDGAYRDVASGRVLDWQEAQARLGKGETQ
jgi:hypothetical protein